MHFSPFLAPLLLLVGQITIISAILTPEEILGRFKDAVTDVNSANSDLSSTTALNAVTKYSLIVEDAIDVSHELINDDSDTTGSAKLNKTAENEISVVAVGQLTTSLLTYLNTLQDKAPDFVDPSQQLGIVAAASALEDGFEAFLISISGITTNVTIQTSIQDQINTVQRAYAFATAAYGDAE